MSYDNYSKLGVEIKDGVATVTLQSGERFNGINWEIHQELGTIFPDLERDDNVNVIVLTGAGGTFCAGANLHWLKGQLKSPPAAMKARKEGRAIILGMVDCPKPIIARVNGDAVGLGATLALFADIIVAVDTATISDPHVNIGLVAGDGGALIWPLLIGYARAKEFLLTGNKVPAVEAARIGLINYAVPKEELNQTVERFASKLAGGASMAIQMTKTVTNIPLRQAVESVLETSLAYESLTLRSDDVCEGVDAFLNRRMPEFRGR
ncbi:enoyl-CoA hydratase [Marinobacter sp. es.048]|uniref:enoyl-CoA hydratase/isomerase family protein n=1 Tax=Marinobacter sp. es.048 TaxID=1761795 RepID=UPI000B58EC94|nr:enoyl-CoA hydratase-related protein [Marinobacter sp. es.048]SNC62638.1 enoyl-CoA hydratase [Marinobacter sp. es.048]